MNWIDLLKCLVQNKYNEDCPIWTVISGQGKYLFSFGWIEDNWSFKVKNWYKLNIFVSICIQTKILSLCILPVGDQEIQRQYIVLESHLTHSLQTLLGNVKCRHLLEKIRLYVVSSIQKKWFYWEFDWTPPQSTGDFDYKINK